ncbi:hypothetical protein TWF718_002121 [Orbilia javanica]|uniref:Uncharacterized protein n=1 Tax=Orbilia javanica TaxID=47235 RepID=A0AAN8NLQ6_9PEZI
MIRGFFGISADGETEADMQVGDGYLGKATYFWQLMGELAGIMWSLMSLCASMWSKHDPFPNRSRDLILYYKIIAKTELNVDEVEICEDQ